MAGWLNNLFDGSGSHTPDAIVETIKRRYFPELWFLVESWLSLAKARAVLDAGCGSGLVSEALAKSGWRVTCFDPDLASLIAVQKKFTAASLEGRFEQGAPEALPFNKDCFDAVVSMNLLEFCDDPIRAAIEMARVLRPGGRAVIATFNRLSPWGLGAVARAVRKDDRNRTCRPLGKRELVRALRAAQFEIDCIKERAHYLPSPWKIGKFKFPIAGCFVALVFKPVRSEFSGDGDTHTRLSRNPVAISKDAKKGR
jgi:SAM-dependent methyltransferase